VPSSQPPFQTTPAKTAGLLLVARRLQEAHGMPRSSVDQILAATGASRDQALEIEAALLAALEALSRSLSSGDSASVSTDSSRIDALTREALHFVTRNAGCTRRNARGRCSASYRQFVIELRARYAEVAASEFADAVDVPVSTLDAWMRSRCGRVARATQALTSPP
jgi:hypothetical protein